MPFREVSGHRALLTLVARAVSRGSLPPSLIFAGPEGVGKRLVAQMLAQALNCEAPVELGAGASRVGPGGSDHVEAGRPAAAFEVDACGRCGACRRIARGVHADVLTIEPGETGAIKVDQVREAIDRAAYRPFEGRRRVVIIDEADALVVEAQSALLKTLEEPPRASVFVLVSARPDMLLPTVQSRCPRLRFGPLSAAEIAATLVRAHGYAEKDAQAAAAAADGSLGRALQEGSGEFTLAREAATNILREVAGGGNPRGRLDSAKELAGGKGAGRSTPGADREELALRLRALGSLLRDLEVLSIRADERLLANADLKSGLVALVKAYDSDRTLRAFSAVDRALGALVERNASAKVVADWLAFQL